MQFGNFRRTFICPGKIVMYAAKCVIDTRPHSKLEQVYANTQPHEYEKPEGGQSSRKGLKSCDTLRSKITNYICKSLVSLFQISSCGCRWSIACFRKTWMIYFANFPSVAGNICKQRNYFIVKHFPVGSPNMSHRPNFWVTWKWHVTSIHQDIINVISCTVIIITSIIRDFTV